MLIILCAVLLHHQGQVRVTQYCTTILNMSTSCRRATACTAHRCFVVRSHQKAAPKLAAAAAASTQVPASHAAADKSQQVLAQLASGKGINRTLSIISVSLQLVLMRLCLLSNHAQVDLLTRNRDCPPSGCHRSLLGSYSCLHMLHQCSAASIARL